MIERLEVFALVKNTDLAGKLLGIVSAQIDYTKKLVSQAGKECLDGIYLSMEMMQVVLQPLRELAAEEPAMSGHSIGENIMYSLQNILSYAGKHSQVTEKIQFETLPLLYELYVDILFWGLCYPDPCRMRAYYENEMPMWCPLPQGLWKYEVSVVVAAYNKLDYTKRCLESLQKYFPEGLNHELILYNNGSSDGTKEYFSSLNPHKQVDLQHNLKSFGVVSRIAEGRYVLFISNDIILTPQAIENMLTCIRSEEEIGCVVPTCPNLSGYQTIWPPCENLSELDDFARNNNRSDPRRWEQRARLVSPMVIAPNNSEGIHAFLGLLYPSSPDRFLAFTDDLMSLLYRRSGRKCILAKDAYVHHHGAVTVNGFPDPLRYVRGRIEFSRAFEVDPWALGAWYELDLFAGLTFDCQEPVSIFGINCGFGSNPLKLKEIYRERGIDTQLYCVTDMSQYVQDLAGISDFFAYVKNWPDLAKTFEGVFFDYIVLEGDLEAGGANLVEMLVDRLKPQGTLALHFVSESLRADLKARYPNARITENWVFMKRLGKEKGCE